MEYDFSHIEKFVQGQMIGDELASFEQALSEETSLQSDVQSYKDMQGFLKTESSIDQSVDALSAVHQEFISSKDVEKKGSSKLKIVMILLGLVVISTLIFYFIFSKPIPKEPAVLYAAHFDPDAMSLTSRGGEDAAQLASISQLYNDKDYETVLTAIQRSGLQLDEHPRLKYIQGISMVATDQNQESRAVLLDLALSEPLYKDDANWYVAMSYLRDEEPISALRYFRMIPVGHKRYDAARELIWELEELLGSG